MDNNLEKAKELFLLSLNKQFEGDLFQAKTFLEEAIKIAPDRKSIINNLLVINFSLKDLNALEKLNQHINNLEGTFSHFRQLGEAQINYINNNHELSIAGCLKLLSEINFKEIHGHCLDLLVKNYFKQHNLQKLFFYLRANLRFSNFSEQSLYNTGSILQYLSKPRAAIYFIKKALQKRDDKSYYSCLAQSYLKIKNFEKGLFYWEYRTSVYHLEKDFISSLKSIDKANDLSQKKILIIYEQGFGDTLMFSRYIKLLKKYTSHISFVVPDKLFNILENFDDKIVVLRKSQINRDKFDYKIPLVSLMKILNARYEDIFYSKIEIKHTNSPISIKKNTYNIAFAHQGNSEYICDHFRSIPFKNFRQLLSLKKVNFYNIAQSKNNYENYDNVQNVGHLNFYEISNLLKNMELIITTDTVFVHLCGSLEIPCILLLSKNAEWRWFNDRKKTIWYPSVRILRQKKIGNWNTEIDIIKKFINLKLLKF